MSNLKIGCWNIHHLKSLNQNKLNDATFIKEISLYDILCLQETKLNNDETISITNYKTYMFSRPCENGFPVSGGMLVLIKPSIVKGVTILNSSCSDIQW